MIKVSIGLAFIDQALGDDLRAALDLARLCDEKGVDLINCHDHVAIGSFSPDEYPDPNKKVGQLPFPIESLWPESIALMAALLAVTKRVRVSCNVLIGPLRPAVLLAKQVATLDCISGGRAEIGLGAGWQKSEFDACGMPFESRFAYLEEQVKVCRILWRDAPAAFEGKHIRFKNLYVLPQPVQGDKLPIWLGVGATKIGCDKIARLADGWFVNTLELGTIAEGVQNLRAAFKARGRDPDSLKVHAEIKPIQKPEGGFDFDAMFASVPAMIESGVTTVSGMPGRYCRGMRETEEFIDRLVALKKG